MIALATTGVEVVDAGVLGELDLGFVVVGFEAALFLI